MIMKRMTLEQTNQCRQYVKAAAQQIREGKLEFDAAMEGFAEIVGKERMEEFAEVFGPFMLQKIEDMAAGSIERN
jgi:hypothetical protein